MYAIYLFAYPNNLLGEETLKERMRGGLREAKTWTSNADKGLSVCLQNNIVLEQLKQTNGHTNVLKEGLANRQLIEQVIYIHLCPLTQLRVDL